MQEKVIYSSLWMLVLLCLSVATIESHDENHPLCFYLKTPVIKQINVTVGSLLDGNTTERCSKATDSCYILWQEDPKNKSITIISQGCWNDANQKCKQNECLPTRSTKALDHTHFCCCEGNFCNTNITDVKYPSDLDDKEPDVQFLGNLSNLMQTVIPLIVVGFLLFAIIIYWVHRRYCMLPKRSSDSLHLIEAPPPSSPFFDLDTLKMGEAIAKGMYGAVYKGSLNEQSVAVKVFAYQNQHHFLNERSIYLLPHMDHPNLPKYIGSKEQTSEEGRPEYILVVSFSPLGCLQDYLKENTYDWNNLCKMISSIASGLAHLHSEIKRGDKFKPSVVHRDVTSRNVLVKADGTCMLCDFGFAVQISGSTYVLNGIEVKAEENSLADVGTFRYMAPEILEGAVNLRDCESSLKQTDVYALGLLMWEVASRCSDLYPGIEVPPYKLPYEAEVGVAPTMDQMQTLVSKRKCRPLFPDIWKTTNPAVRLLKETIEDCWDQDAEARLTTLCVEERITELPVLWEREKAGLTVSLGISPSLNTLSNLPKSCYFNKSSNDSNFGSESMDDRLISTRERANSLSECTTETLLSPSDTVSQTNDKNKLLNSSPLKVTYPLQPHQGRNPCLARNLMQELPPEAPIIGNSLLDRPSKYSLNKKMISFSDGDANIFNMPPGMESNLIPTSHSNRVCNPIPYVQNQVNFSSSIPKQTNLVGRKQDVILKSEKQRWNPLNIFDKKSTIRASLRMLLDRKTSVSSGYIPEEQQPLKSPVVASPTSPSDLSESKGQSNPINSFWSSDNKDSDAFSAACDPNFVDGNAVMKSYDHHLLNGHAILVNERGSLPAFESVLTQAEKSKRPTTLPVQSSLEKEANNKDFIDVSDNELSKEVSIETATDRSGDETKPAPIRRKGSGSRRRGVVKRVKTPFELKSRFSLYDDRIMSSQELPSASVPHVPQSQLDSSKFSASVPLNMNAFCTSPASSDPALPNSRATEIKLQEVRGSQKTSNLSLPGKSVGQPNVFSLCDI